MSKQFDEVPGFEILGTVRIDDLVGSRYEQLIDWAQPMEDAHESFRVIPGDFVTAEDLVLVSFIQRFDFWC